MNKPYSSDCPNLNMCPSSKPHENRFDLKIKKSESIKNEVKLQNKEKTKA